MINPEQLRQYQQQMTNMDPASFAAQASAMRGMDKATLRRMNPQFATMTDQQIDFAINQVEMMSKNPAMFEMAKNQLKQLSPEQLQQQAQAAQTAIGAGNHPAANGYLEIGARVKLKGLGKAPEHNGKLGSVIGYQGDRCKVALDGENRTLALRQNNLERSGPSPSLENLTNSSNNQTAPLPNMKNIAENLDPESIREQARQLKSMDPATIRLTNPQMAHMTDEQIQSAVQQMDTMADLMKDPAMAQMVKQQLSNMTPEQLQAFQSMSASGGAALPQPNLGGRQPVPSTQQPPSTGGMPDAETAARMMSNMDPSQLESMIGMIKENPEMFKNMLKSNPMTANLDDATIDAQLKMMDKLDPNQLKQVLGFLAKAQKVFAPAVQVYAKVDKAIGGRLKHILLGILAALAAALLSKFTKWITGYSIFGPLFSLWRSRDAPLQQEILSDAVDSSNAAATVGALDSEQDEFLDLDSKL
mmetsp:Transcript_3355/g.4675  ORF Transcript_3355/g.4675 Transcript_3355/m.4675 type:complete len:473 (+) Transcript_3355:133-1551(+)